MTALLHVPEPDLKQALGLYGFDCLGGWGATAKVRRWHTPIDRKNYGQPENGRHRVHPKHLLAHVRGESTIAVARITNTLVLDADVQDVPDDEEAPEELRWKGRQIVRLFLDTFALPGVTFDSPGGSHTHIRLPRDPRDDETAAARAILNQWAAERKLPVRFDVYPDGDKPIRLPFGVYLGRRWHPRPGLTADEQLAWLAHPERASLDALGALRRAGARMKKRRAKTKPATRTAVTGVEASENWPVRARTLLTHGLILPGTRHAAYFNLAREAAIWTDDQETIRAALQAIPLKGHSSASAVEIAYDLRRIPADVLERKQLTGRAGLYAGCPIDDRHTPADNPEARERASARDFWRPYCEMGCEGSCRILAPTFRPETTDFAQVWRSPIWRSSTGLAAGTGGLGQAARRVYGIAIDLALGIPDQLVQLDARYVETKHPDVGRKTAARAIQTLAHPDAGLLVPADGPSFYLLPRVTAEHLAALEGKGTRENYERAVRRHVEHWQSRRK